MGMENKTTNRNQTERKTQMKMICTICNEPSDRVSTREHEIAFCSKCYSAWMNKSVEKAVKEYQDTPTFLLENKIPY